MPDVAAASRLRRGGRHTHELRGARQRRAPLLLPGAIARLAPGCIAAAWRAWASGLFESYKQQRISQWQPELPLQPAVLQSTDPAFASDRPGEPAGVATDGRFASLDP